MVIIETKKSLIKSILFLIFGALIFAYPNQVVSITSMAFGILLIAYGIFMAIKNYYDTKSNSNNSSTTLLIGIFAIVAGILFIVFASSISHILQYVLGAWILFTGIERLIIALSMGRNNNNFMTQLIVAILLLLAGLYTILRAHIEIQIVGLVMMIYAVLEIIGFITNKQENVSHVKEEIEKKIEHNDDKNEKDDENIKDAKIVEEKEKKTKTKKKTSKK